MADKLVRRQSKDGTSFREVFHDNTDGTYSQQVHVVNDTIEIASVTVSSITAGDNNIGNVDIASISAGDNNIGNVDIASIAAGTANIGGVTRAGYNWTTVFGVSSAVFISADASTAAAVTDAPSAGQKLVIDSVIISSAAALTIDLESETAAVKIAQFYMAAASTVVFEPTGKVKLAVADKKLMVKASGAGAIAVTAVYHSEA
jgi:hypothetical protein